MSVSKKKLSQHAKDNPCIRCGNQNEFGIAHYNGYLSHQFGKGRGIKCDDTVSADFCFTCDLRYSEANYSKWEGGSKSIDRSERFLKWIMLSNIRRNDNGVFG